ncbi:lysoplasmalogenase isoform X2 [Scleropages formosus]|uniref:lysoplasmalogenase n=1 Tax=Scleropages formosus TaxID=113540 RepID=A0A8C9RJR0_SCLFO|nr:lysoplasmalogenase-like isoform X2 [Scleropages formosus]
MDILETHAYDRRQRRNTSCVLCLALLPFFLCTCIYFHLWIPESSPSPFAAALKCGPVLSLALLVLCYNGGQSLWGVAGGLVLSAGGDACLVWPERFLHGMACFGAAHLLYCAAFLSQRYSSPSSSIVPLLCSIALWATGGTVYYHILPFVQQNPDAGVLVPAVAVYTLLIVTMATLAVRTRRPLTGAGSLVFMVSDLSLALQVFQVIEPSTGIRVVVMATYYLAQLLIAVGDVSAGAEQEDGLGKRKRV